MKTAWLNPVVFSVGLACAVVGASQIQTAYGWLVAGLVLMGLVVIGGGK